MHSAIALLLAATLISGSSEPPPHAKYRRVRGADGTSEHVIAGAMARSAIVRELIARLERSDLIVYVQVVPYMAGAAAVTNFIKSTADARYVRISLHASAHGREQIVLLGHELEHAREIAGAPGVRDRTAFRQFYQRIGRRTSFGNQFETAEALRVGLAIRAELGGHGAGSVVAFKQSRDGRAPDSFEPQN